jgi:hypothetical protein
VIPLLLTILVFSLALVARVIFPNGLAWWKGTLLVGLAGFGVNATLPKDPLGEGPALLAGFAPSRVMHWAEHFYYYGYRPQAMPDRRPEYSFEPKPEKERAVTPLDKIESAARQTALLQVLLICGATFSLLLLWFRLLPPSIGATLGTGLLLGYYAVVGVWFWLTLGDPHAPSLETAPRLFRNSSPKHYVRENGQKEELVLTPDGSWTFFIGAQRVAQGRFGSPSVRLDEYHFSGEQNGPGGIRAMAVYPGGKLIPLGSTTPMFRLVQKPANE